MASFQAYQSYAQNKGTLLPGQPITVNKYTVQVERYLAQGGFAHVYLVTTAVPVHNTTRHVLKRIAVANEAMLAEVKKEVDIMRILRGHPNIVHLIDAAWHRMPNGLYEVFILMEFCSGGGLIDMMNRRLRERLTEAEILQIFVDVCEGVAAMHNLRPPLLHRDLKVENILQSSATSFKLCDFGSATPVAARAPATTQEIRALEADLNRHTTLQYRAPEMVDSFLRRPVNEKSDVWALGVLLYKLCYYTTPFEEHGPLAILNVQYRIPPYPVYSAQINSLIASMLREHSAQRPSVFELLSTVHGLRGSKSLFLYPIPSAPLLSPKPLQQPQLIPPSDSRPQQHPNNPVTSPPSNKNATAGVQARERVLEAIAPMRRGRPSSSKESKSQSRPASPQKLSDSSKALDPKTDVSSPNWLEDGFDGKARRAIVNTEENSRGTGKEKNLNDAWVVKGAESTSGQVGQSSKAFDDDFGKKLWDSFSPVISSPGTSSNAPKLSIPRYRPSAFTGSETTRSPVTAIPRVKTKDAFGDLGLNLGKQPPAPTLGEARKLRTGLAILSTTTPQGHNFENTVDLNKSGTSSSRPTPSPRPSYLSPSPSQFQSSSKSHSPSPSSSSPWKLSNPILSSRPSPSLQLDGLPVESRFPSLEELDASFAKEPSPPVSGEQQLQVQDKFLQPPPLPSRSKLTTTGPGNLPRPIIQSYSRDGGGGSGVKSEQVTGVAMRESSANKNLEEPPNNTVQGAPRETSRPALRRKHRSTVSMQQTPRADPDSGAHLEPPASIVSVSRSSPQLEARDWLTGDDDGFSPHSAFGSSTSASIETSVRDSPSKSSSFVEGALTQPPHEIIPTQTKDTLPPSPVSPSKTSSVNARSTNAAPPTPRTSRILPPTVKNATQYHVPRSSNNDWSPVTVSGQNATDGTIESKATKPRAQKDPSWHVKGPRSATPTMAKEPGKESSSDEGPEDVGGYVPPSKASQVKKQEQAKKSHKGRQSSVHELVDLWGGAAVPSSNTGSGSNIDSSAKGHRRRPTTAGLPLPLTQASPASTPRSASPLQSAPADSRPTKRHSRPSKLPIPEPEQHSRQLSASTSTRSPVSSRSRPQSMFLFPVSKSTSDGSPPSAGLSNSVAVSGLSASDDSRRRPGVRRTSISDMVQLYETIGGKAKPLEPPIVLSKPVSKTSPHQESNSYLKAPLGTIPGPPTGDDTLNSRSSPNESHLSTVSSKIRSSPTRSINNPSLRTSPVGPRDIGRSKEKERSMPPKTLPYKPSNPSGEITLESLDARFPSRKSTTSTEESTKPGDERSSSPDRPYQGVGKLIAQWQRKTEEADPSRNPVNIRRGGVPKRPLASGGDRGR